MHDDCHRAGNDNPCPREENPPRVWEIAKAGGCSGAPKYSDVTVRNLRPHPIPGKRPDPYDTLEMIPRFTSPGWNGPIGSTRHW